MSNYRRDSMDDAINRAGAAVAGLLVTGWLGYVVNSARKKHLRELEEQRRLKLPELLESSEQNPIVYAATQTGRKRTADGTSEWDGVEGSVSLADQLALILAALVLIIAMVKGIFWTGALVGALIVAGEYSARRLFFAPAMQRRGQKTLRDKNERQRAALLSQPTIYHVYSVKLPPKTVWQSVRAGEFMSTLLERFTGLAFQIVATHEQLDWRILDLRCNADPNDLTVAIQSFYPQAEVVVSDAPSQQNNAPVFRYVMQFRHLRDFFQPMKRADDLRQSDPLIALTQEMSALLPGERIVYSLYVADYARFAHEQALNFLVRKVPKNPLRFMSSQGIFEAIAELGLPEDMEPLYPPTETDLYLTKLVSPLYLSFLMVQVDAASPERVLTLSHLDGHVAQLDYVPYNGLMAFERPMLEDVDAVDMPEQHAATSIEGVIAAWVSGANADWREHPLILDGHELAALWHLPYEEFTSSRIVWGKTHIFVPMPAEVARNKQGICLGYNGGSERALPIYMPLENRTTHMAIIGRTGTGKSTLMHNLIYQDIAAGRGVAVIDPHGTLVRDVIARSIPVEREDDVVLLDFAQEEYPPPLNPLVLPDGASQRDAAGQMMTIIQQFYRGFEGQMADTLYMTLLTLMQEPSPTIRDVTRLYASPRYRASLAEQLDNPAAEDFWTVFNRLSPGEQEQRRSPVEHRMRSFYGNPALYPVLCHPKTLDVAALIRERKVVLISLEAKRAGIPPRDQQLLGAILIAQIQQAVMGHAAVEHGYYLYVDEAEDFITTSLPEMLSQARFANLSLILANQYLKQLAGETLEAVMANVGAIAAFQCYEPDARALLPYLRRSFEMDDLLNVDVFQAALWMRVKQQQAVMSLNTAPKPELAKGDGERYERIRAKSIANYTPMCREDVLKWLRERYPKVVQTPTDEEQWYDKG